MHSADCKLWSWFVMVLLKTKIDIEKRERWFCGRVGTVQLRSSTKHILLYYYQMWPRSWRCGLIRSLKLKQCLFLSKRSWTRQEFRGGKKKKQPKDFRIYNYIQAYVYKKESEGRKPKICRWRNSSNSQTIFFSLLPLPPPRRPRHPDRNAPAPTVHAVYARPS